MHKEFFVYIVSSPSRTIYVGMTSDLEGRIWQHKNKIYKGFTSTCGVDRLVYYEMFGTVDDAIAREKELKGWKRNRKTALIEQKNPKWYDLSHSWFAG